MKKAILSAAFAFLWLPSITWAQKTIVSISPDDYECDMMIAPIFRQDPADDSYYAYIGSGTNIRMYQLNENIAKATASSAEDAANHTKAIQANGLSADKSGAIVSVDEGNIIKIWTSSLSVLKTIEERKTQYVYQSGMGAAAIAPNENWVAYAIYSEKEGEGTLIKLKDYFISKEIKVLKGHGRELITKVVFSPDGKYLMSQSKSELIIWDVESGSILSKHNSEDIVCHTFSNDSKSYILQSDGTLYKKSLKGIIETTFETSFEKIAFVNFTASADGKYLYAARMKNLKKWDINTGAELGNIDYYGMTPSHSIILPNGKVALCINSTKLNLVELEW